MDNTSRFQDYFINLGEDTPSPLSSYPLNKMDNILQSLYKLYIYQGPSWKMIQTSLQAQHIEIQLKINPKNYIYNAIRKSSKRLAEHQKNELGKTRGLVNKQIILSILEIVNQMQKQVLARKLHINQDGILFSFKKCFMRFTLWEGLAQKDEMTQLIEMIKYINLKLRCLGIFKVKNRKNWKISDKALSLILSFDRIAQQGDLNTTRQELSKKIETQKTLDRPQLQPMYAFEHSQSSSMALHHYNEWGNIIQDKNQILQAQKWEQRNSFDYY